MLDIVDFRRKKKACLKKYVSETTKNQCLVMRIFFFKNIKYCLFFVVVAIRLTKIIKVDRKKKK